MAEIPQISFSRTCMLLSIRIICWHLNIICSITIVFLFWQQQLKCLSTPCLILFRLPKHHMTASKKIKLFLWIGSSLLFSFLFHRTLFNNKKDLQVLCIYSFFKVIGVYGKIWTRLWSCSEMYSKDKRYHQILQTYFSMQPIFW